MEQNYRYKIETIVGEEESEKHYRKKEEKVSDNIFFNINKYSHEEYQYLNLIENILENGTLEEGRNGKTKSIFGNSKRIRLVRQIHLEFRRRKTD